jgi:hypothetical protein
MADHPIFHAGGGWRNNDKGKRIPSKYRRAHYQDFASMLGKHKRAGSDVSGFQADLEDMFKSDNPDFQHDKFRKAIDKE